MLVDLCSPQNTQKALNNSAGDRQLQEPLLLESLQVRPKAEVDTLRVSQSSWEALLGGASAQPMLLMTRSRPLRNFLMTRHTTRQGQDRGSA